MAKFVFTRHRIETLPTPGAKRAFHRDTRTDGLGVIVQPSGHRSFFWYRKVRGRPTWKTIGSFPDLSVENARAKAAELNTAIARWKASDYQGDEPLRRRHGLKLKELFENYLERHRKARAKNPERAVQSDRWKFNAYLSPWETRTLSSIRRSDIRSLHEQLGEINGKVTANRVIEFLRTLFNWASRAELWQGENPAKGIEGFPESSRTRFVLPSEMPRLFLALSDKKTNRDLRDFVLLSLFTGARRSNILAMRWDQVDFKRELWGIPEPKSRVPYVVPLTPEAIEILKLRKRTATSYWIFPSGSREGHLTDVKRSWKTFLDLAKLSGLKIHDLRRTLGSWQAAAGVSLPIIGKSLGHQSPVVTQIYARLHLDPVREAIRGATQAMRVAGKLPKRKRLRAAGHGK